MAAVETKFKVKVEGIEEYIDNLERAEELITDISDKLKKGDLSLDETVELTETLDNLEQIKATYELTNEVAAKQVEINAKNNTELGKQVGIVEAQLATVDILNEAYALQNKEIGLAKSEAERLLEITELQNEAETLATTELGKQKKEAERNLVLAEAQAEALAATPGSLRQLNAELEKANLELENLSPDSEGFKTAKNNAAQLQLQIDGLSRTSKEQKEANFALADSFVGTFGQGAALVSSFAGENENLQAVLLKLEQALAAVEAVRSAIALIEQVQNELRLKQGAKLAAAKAKEIKATQDKAKAEQKGIEVIKDVTTEEKKLEKQTNELVEANKDLIKSNENTTLSYIDLEEEAKDYNKQAKATADNTEKTGKSTSLFGKAISGLKGGFSAASQGAKGLGASLIATGIPIIIASVVGLIAVFALLRDKIKPVADAFNFVEDVVGGFMGVVSNAGNIIKAFIGTLSNVGNAIKTIFSGDFTKGIDDLKNSFNGLGDELATSFKKGFDKSGKLRLIQEQENLNKLTAISKNNLIERLGLESKNADQISQLKQAQLKQEADIAKQKLLLNNNLSEAEFNTLTKGTDAEIKALKERLKARNDFSDSLIDGLQEVADKENELQSERKAQFDARVDAALEASNLQRDLQRTRLSNEESTDSQIELARIDLEQKLAELDAKAAKGEKVSLLERQIANEEYAKAVEKIQEDLKEQTIKNTQDTADIFKQAEIDELASFEAKSDELIDQEEAIAKHRLAINKQLSLDLEKNLRDEQEALKDITDEALKESIQEDFAAKRIQIEKKTNSELLKNDKELLDARNKAEEDAKKTSEKLANDRAKSLTDQAKKLNEDAKDILKFSRKERLDFIKQASEKEVEATRIGEELKLKALKLTDDQIKVFKEKGVKGLSEQYKDLSKEVVNSLEDIEKASANSLAEITKNTNEAVKKTGGGLEDTLNKVSAFFQKNADNINKITSAVTETLGAVNDFVQQNAENQIANIENEVEVIDKSIDETTEKVDASKDRINDLQDNLKKARGSDRKAILANLKAEQNAQKQLMAQKEADEKRKKDLKMKEFEIAKAAFEFQKGVDIANAIISGGLAVIQRIADPFPINLVSVPLTIATVAIQIASIAGQQGPEPPQLAIGGFTKQGHRDEPAGIVHAGEWVAPKWMVESPKYRNDIMRLESMRSNGYATGGIVTTNTSTTKQDSSTKQFDALINGIGALAQRPIYTNVVQVSDEQNRINNIRTKASL